MKLTQKQQHVVTSLVYIGAVIILATAILWSIFFFRLSRTDNLKAEHAYRSQEYDKAEEILKKLQVNDPDNPLLSFNLGVASYKQEKFDDAESHFSRATTQSEDRLTRSDANTEALTRLAHRASANAGNSSFRTAQKYIDAKNKDEAIETLERSAGHYRHAISHNPEDEVSKKILALIEELIRKLKEEPPENDNDQQDQKQNQSCDKNNPQQNQQGDGQQQPSQGQDQKQSKEDRKRQKSDQQSQQNKQGNQEQDENPENDGEQKEKSSGANDDQDKSDESNNPGDQEKHDENPGSDGEQNKEKNNVESNNQDKSDESNNPSEQEEKENTSEDGNSQQDQENIEQDKDLDEDQKKAHQDSMKELQKQLEQLRQESQEEFNAKRSEEQEKNNIVKPAHMNAQASEGAGEEQNNLLLAQKSESLAERSARLLLEQLDANEAVLQKRRILSQSQRQNPKTRGQKPW